VSGVATRGATTSRAAAAPLAVDVRYGTRRPFAPAAARLAEWARAAAGSAGRRAELSIRVVTPAESRRLNATWRGRDKPTNVLSFPADDGVPAGPAAGAGRARLLGTGRVRLLGDIAICAAVVAREAREQRKALRAHWAHMVVHGTLHLLGHDHERGPREAQAMEGREKRVLARLGFPDPYVTD
jgi:probable rRNA maturation factor